ncbi:anti-sigma factor [Streptomyces griseus]|uniref:anti-sigma factor family protein n=1 Tax=Streptomyces griseus TaxID=1911 RepID=UPI0004C4D4C3|nr:zf-HC2 domain-containing protein [Streptomyces griseus]
MSGTGPTGPTPAEAHLGDRLAALVDGELKHDARERVLAHLATCAKCKAEADAQRRLKSAFAMSASPSPSEGFLARLQGLPGGPGGDGPGSGTPFGGSGPFAEEFFPGPRPTGSGAHADPAPSPLDGFGYVPAAHGSTAVLPGGPGGSVFRIHDVARDADRSPWRGRRFAFAAAGAVSLAAIALGGTLPLDSGPEPSLRAEGAGNNVSPLDAETRAENGAKAVSRRGGGALTASDEGLLSPAQPSGTAPSGTNSVPPALTGKAPTTPAVTPPVNRKAPPTTPRLFAGQVPAGHPFVLPVLNVTVPPLVRPAAPGTPLPVALGSGAKPKAAPSAPLPGVPANDLASPLSPRP